MVLPLMMLVSGCLNASKPNDTGLCDGLTPLVDAHVDGLLEDGGPKSLTTGQALVAGFDGGCDAG